MTTKPSNAPWVDSPFKLIPTPSKRPGLSNPDHFYVRAATGMTHAHNAIIRGLNAILLQAPNVPSSSDKDYKPKDVKDLLWFTGAWIKMVNHHHSVEETYIFPEMGKFSGDPNLMEGPLHQHTLFQNGLDALSAYVVNTRPEAFRWGSAGGMQEIVDSFSKHLTDHLYDEIDVFLGLGYLDSEGFKKVWVGTHVAAAENDNFRQKISLLSDVFPMVYCCSDRTFEGGHPFPMLHWTLPYCIKYWFALGNGAWRFGPSDWWCIPRPLSFGPSE
ncbi:hypothetical protein F5Y16DRAFT_356867 [Xylariaceae sp. FL0255]|nr:hypothetical protein F5Y16DRAFT_356867 [Xylariaceae sp. FL0255]